MPASSVRRKKPLPTRPHLSVTLQASEVPPRLVQNFPQTLHQTTMLPPPTLPDELLEEVFLRLPPDEPACLVRASLASKLWLDLLTGPAFRSRYTELHGAPPMLGFLLSYLDREKRPARPTFRLHHHKSDWGQRKYETLDCRHGRVLLADKYVGFGELAVWDPMTGCRRLLNAPDEFIGLGAAVLSPEPLRGALVRAEHE